MSRSPSGSRSRSRGRSVSRTRSRSRGRSSYRRGSGSRGGSRDKETSESAVEEAKLLLEAGVIKFCDEHMVDMAPTTCVTCRLVTRTVRGPVLPELIKLVKDKTAVATEIPAAAQRFAVRIDERPPTLTLSESDMSLAESGARGPWFSCWGPGSSRTSWLTVSCLPCRCHCLPWTLCWRTPLCPLRTGSSLLRTCWLLR